uniref:hypothetical protein n=1 Tax=Tardiphaga sp. TaxID=1926292 RepID=UPI0037DA2135
GSLIAQPPVRSSDAGERIHALAIDLTLKGWCATENEINRITKEAERKLLDFACDEIKRHMDRAAPVTQSAATSKQVPAFGMMKANGDLLPCAVAEEDAIYHVCAPMFDVSAEYVRAKLEAAGWHTVRVQISIDPTDPLARNDRGSPSNG